VRTVSEDELIWSRLLIQRMSTARRAWWMYVGAMTFYGVVALAQLILHGSTS